MVREIIKPTSEFYSLHIPKEYINHEVEILILPFSYDKKTENEKSKSDDIFSKTSGLLQSRHIDPLKWQQEMRDDRKI